MALGRLQHLAADHAIGLSGGAEPPTLPTRLPSKTCAKSG